MAITRSQTRETSPFSDLHPVSGRDQTGPIFFLHGFMGTCRDHFGPQIRAWSATSRMYALDLPGHGSSGLEARRPYYSRAQDLLARQLAKTGPGRVLAVSYLGGTVAINTALRHPHLFQSLVLSGVTCDVPHAAFMAWIEGFSRLAEQNADLRAYYRTRHGVRWRSTLETVQAECRENYEGSVWLPQARILDLKVPTIILNGALKSNESAICEALHGATQFLSARTVTEAGHIAGVDQPDPFNTLVQDFWTRISEGTHDV